MKSTNKSAQNRYTHSLPPSSKSSGIVRKNSLIGYRKMLTQPISQDFYTHSKNCENSTEAEATYDSQILQFLRPHASIISKLNYSSYDDTIQSQAIFLLSIPSKPILILDIDGTIVYNDNGTIKVRPYLEYFLITLRSKYSLWIWTAGNKAYLNHIANLLDSTHLLFDLLLDSDYCITMGGYLIKDINIFGNLLKKNVVIVDDQLISFVNSLDNGILVAGYRGNEGDSELMVWLELLLNALEYDDISTYLQIALKIRHHLLYLMQQNITT